MLFRSGYNAGGLVGYAQSTGYTPSFVKANLDKTTATLTFAVLNNQFTSEYNLQLETVDSQNLNLLPDATYTIYDSSKQVFINHENVALVDGKLDIGKIDIDNLFQNIKTKDTNYFDFKNEFISAVYELNDLHTSPYFGWLPLNNYIYICPVSLKTEYDKKAKKALMYATFSFNEAYYSFFKDGKHVAETIKNNLKTPIESINGKDPFTFIQEFSGIKLRSKHGTYAFNQVTYCNNNFNIPATLEELTNFTVKYANGKNFTSEYVVQDLSPHSNNIKLYENNEDNEKFLEYIN